MLRWSQFRLHSVQAVIFTPDAGQFSQSSLLATVLGEFRSRYNGSVEALPLPDDVPAELPRVILHSKDETYKIQAGPARIDSFFVASESPEGNGLVDCTEVLEHYVRSTPSLRVGRLALIISRRAEDANPAQSLIDRFCNEEVKRRPFNDSSHFEVHNHKCYQLSSLTLQVNSWVRCKTITVKSPEPRDIVLVEQDINTLDRDARQTTFNIEQIRAFFTSAATEADSILSIYFPEEI